MKIYTKTGDKGKTSLLTGKRVPKYHPRIEAYGTVDELNSFIGLLRSYDLDKKSNEILGSVQNQLFSIGSSLAMDVKHQEITLNEIAIGDVEILENDMDRIDSILPKLKSFIIPGGSQAIAICHVCRCVCRRAERLCVELSDNERVDEIIVIYLNRLSDYFFMLARKIAFDNNIEVPLWKNEDRA
jgi:cob(I)alamin adenosyltransferase